MLVVAVSVLLLSASLFVGSGVHGFLGVGVDYAEDAGGAASGGGGGEFVSPGVVCLEKASFTAVGHVAVVLEG